MELKHIQEEILQDLAFKPASEWSEAERYHIDTCPECQEGLEAYQLIFAELGDQPAPVFSASFEAGILDQIPELNPGSELIDAPVADPVPSDESYERTPWWQWGGIAASVAAGIGVFLYTFLPAAQTPALDSFSERMGSIGSRFGEWFSFVDGNEILISAGIVSFASIFFLDRFLNRRQKEEFIPE